MRKLIAKIPFTLTLIVCLTIGLAPFQPEPHVWEKLKMLADGTLIRPIDIFDLVMHGTPWLILLLKIVFGQWRSKGT